jgi:osmoprotectant transport system permease protein
VNEPLVRWDWVGSHLDDIVSRTIEHLVLTGLAVGIGFVVAMALALLALRFRRTYAPITWVTGVLYTIPSIALFALLIPVTGLTTTTAEVGLVSYTLLILVRNIVAGIDGVPEAVRDAARGMGYTRWRMFASIELPLALPVIIAGIRIATVSTVGLVTVTALIGQGGYGAFINDGLQRFFNTPLVVGAVLAVALAVVLDVLLVLTERALTPWARTRTV